MKYTRIKAGHYKFEGIDNWNNQPMEGTIEYQPYDIEISRTWKVVFEYDGITESPFFGSTLKSCKDWLEKPLIKQP